MRFSIIICTHNRAAHLRDTLAHIARLDSRNWEVLVVDNNSTDETATVVAEFSSGFPAPLTYIFEGAQGKYTALNTGIREASGEIIAATDDDARVAPDWLERAAAGLDEHACGFVGGPVTPLWDGQRPQWLDTRSVLVQKVLALSDHGAAAQEYGANLGWPLGVNIAYRREALALVGPFDRSLGRVAGTLRSQSQREWHLRARAHGIRGVYLPDMRVEHRVVVERLKKDYFRRWFYWHGISRASLYWRLGVDLEEPEKVRHDCPLPAIGGVPNYLWSKAARTLRSWLRHSLDGGHLRAFEAELLLCFIAGMAVECRRLRTSLPPFREAGVLALEVGGRGRAIENQDPVAELHGGAGLDRDRHRGFLVRESAGAKRVGGEQPVAPRVPVGGEIGIGRMVENRQRHDL